MPRMAELTEAGLFGRGLIPIEDPLLVKRYNHCLVDMGLVPTSLPRFHIDMMGWSPEVAAEQRSEYYLSHGEANPLAIVLVPDQFSPRTPIYFPFHSFDWDLMRVWGSVFRTPLFELTRDTALWLDIDQEVSDYHTPADLLGVHEVIVRTYSPSGLITRAVKQQELVTSFLRDDDAHQNAALIESLRQSRNETGDLRRRSLIIRDHPFSDVRNFYSRAFGGVFVLRSRSDDPLIFCRDPKVAKQHGLYVADKHALKLLVEHGYADTDIEWWRHNLYRLEIIAESYLMEVLDEHEPELEFLSLNTAQQKAIVQKYREHLSMYRSLIRLVRAFEKGSGPVKVPRSLAGQLIHPKHDLSKSSYEVVAQLLTYIFGGRLVPLFYRHQKTAFIDAYQRRWKAPRREWARKRVREYYDLSSKSSGIPS